MTLFNQKTFLCPDVLCSCEKSKPTARLRPYNSIWLNVSGDLTPGEYPIKISLEQGGNVIGESEYTVKVLDFLFLGKPTYIGLLAQGMIVSK